MKTLFQGLTVIGIFIIIGIPNHADLHNWDILQMAARGMIGQDVLEAYEVQEQVVLGFPGMIETTKSALRKLYEEKDRILTGC